MSTIVNQNQEDENKSQTVEQTNQQGQINSGNSVGGSTIPTSTRPKGSGRFTNIQKYIDANKSGSNVISQGINNKVQNNLNKQEQKTNDYYGKIRQGISNANQNIQQGQTYQNQLQQIGQNIQNNSGAAQFQNRNSDLGINSFVNNPNFDNFQNFQAGNNVDQRLLSIQQQRLANQNKEYLNQSQNVLNDLNTAGGRFNMLTNTFGGNLSPNYTTGQQRLDSMFLTDQSLRPVQQNLKQDVLNARNMANDINSTNSDVQRIAQQESSLINQINDQATANEKSYIDRLNSYVNSVNQGRNSDWKNLQDALASYRPSDAENSIQRVTPGLSNEQLRRLGVQGEHGAYDVLENLKGAEDVAIKGREARDYTDVANQSDVDAYNDLAKIARMRSENKRLTEAANLGDAYTARNDEGNLVNRFNDADKAFTDKLKEIDYNESKTFRTGGTSFNKKYGTRASRANALDLLNNGGDGTIGTSYTGESLWDRASKQLSETAAFNQKNDILTKFRDMLNNSNYGRTIGGNLNSDDPNIGYGTRESDGGLENYENPYEK